MQYPLDFFYTLKDLVIEPTFFTALMLFVFSALNEIIALFPFSILIASQVFFLQDTSSIALLVKLVLIVSFSVGLGSAIGTLPLYTLSYLGGRPAILKYEKYLRFSWHDVERLSSHLKGEWYDEAIILFFRSVPILPSIPVTIAAGVIRVRFVPYIILTIVGLTFRMILTFLIIGFGLGNLFKFLNVIYNV